MRFTIILIAIVVSLIWLINVLLFTILLNELEWIKKKEDTQQKKNSI